MHAWAEAYLPGAGWRGFDPSQGLSIFDNHIAVAAGQRSQDATPISGNFRGKAESHFKAFISICHVEN
jgi:transglutaminase-like putative cysteine protease